MGRHSAPETGLDNEDRTVPIRRIPAARTPPTGQRPMRTTAATDRPIRTSTGTEKQVPGVLFPIVDDLSMISADDHLLDLIAVGRSDFGDVFATSLPMASGYAYPARNLGGALEPMLVTWRSELAEVPLPATPKLPALVRVMRAPADKTTRRSVKPMLAAAVAICALLLGSTAVGARSAEPGDPLWALSEVLYSGHADSVKARQAVDKSLKSAGALLSQGDAPQALVALTSASGQLERVELGADRQALQTTFDVLWVKAHTEVAAAGSASGAPGRGAQATVVAEVASSGPTGVTNGLTSPAKPATSGSTSVGTTAGTTTRPTSPGSSSVPIVLVPPPTRGTTSGPPSAPVKQPTAPVTTPPQHSSPPSVPPASTHPVSTPPPSIPVTTPTTPVSVTPPSDTPTTPTPTPSPTSEPVPTDVTSPSIEVSTTSEMPSATSSDSPSDPLAANGAAPAQVTDASQ